MSRKVSTSSFTKLHAKRARPFKIKRRLGLNAYLIELPLDYNVSSIFNMANLTKYKGEEDVVVHEAPVWVPTVAASHDELEAILDHQFVTTR